MRVCDIVGVWTTKDTVTHWQIEERVEIQTQITTAVLSNGVRGARQ